ncbi:hypothetical protein EI555_020868, partial [Monodon monoceros]
SQGSPVEAPQTQTFIITQGPLTWSTPGALSRSAACPAPVFLATPVMETIVTAPAVGVTQAGKGSWTPGFPPQAPPLAAQLAPIIRPVNYGPWPHGTSREGSLATNQSYASHGDCSNPQSMYSNFRRWQRLKQLAWRHLPQSPDAEALSCFLIPVLRSVARLKPTMMLEGALCRAVQEWQRRSNFDRMIYYEMAEKFMEFEAKEEMQIQKLQWMQCAQDLPPPAPLKLDPRGPPSPENAPLTSPLQQCMRLQVVLTPPTPKSMSPKQCPHQPCVPRMSSPRAQPSRPKPHRSQRPPEPKAPKEIPPEAVREYMDIMDALVGPVHSATGESDAERGEDGNELKQEEDGIYSDPGLLSYIDKLCSQEDFVTKATPGQGCSQPLLSVRELLSPDPQLDLLALAEELEQEEGLTPEEMSQRRERDTQGARGPHRRGTPGDPGDRGTQMSQGGQRREGSPLVQKQLLALKEDEGVRAAPSHSAPGMGSSPSESDAGQGAQRHDQDPHLGVSDEACPPEIDSEAPCRLIQRDTGLCRPKAFVSSRGRSKARWPSTGTQGCIYAQRGLSCSGGLRAQGRVRVLPMPQAWPPLEVGGPRVLPTPPPLREEAPAQLHQLLPSRGRGLCLDTQLLLRSCPSPGLASSVWEASLGSGAGSPLTAEKEKA